MAVYSQITGGGSSLPALTDGELFIGVTGMEPAANTLTAGANITITNSAGGITIASSGTGAAFTWNNATSGSTFTIAKDNGYIANNTVLQTFTLPATAVVGDTFELTNANTGGFLIAQNALQHIRLGSAITTIGTGGSIASSALGDSVRVICIGTNTSFQCVSGTLGNLTIV